jgi:hypothetical protein
MICSTHVVAPLANAFRQFGDEFTALFVEKDSERFCGSASSVVHLLANKISQTCRWEAVRLEAGRGLEDLLASCVALLVVSDGSGVLSVVSTCYGLAFVNDKVVPLKDVSHLSVLSGFTFTKRTIASPVFGARVTNEDVNCYVALVRSGYTPQEARFVTRMLS